MNTVCALCMFQGSFPERDTAEDGYHGLSPVTAFPAQNSYGTRPLDDNKKNDMNYD